MVAESKIYEWRQTKQRKTWKLYYYEKKYLQDKTNEPNANTKKS